MTKNFPAGRRWFEASSSLSCFQSLLEASEGKKSPAKKGNGTRFLESRSRFQLQFICISSEKELKISWGVVTSLAFKLYLPSPVPKWRLKLSKIGSGSYLDGKQLGNSKCSRQKPKAGSIAVACEPTRWAANSFKAHRFRESLDCVLDSLLETALQATWMGLAVWSHENGQI